MCYKNTPANQPSPGCTLSLTQWLNMPLPCRHIMTHNLSKRECKCVALRRPKLGKLRWCYRNLSMRGLVTFKKINFFIDRTIFNEPWKPKDIPWAKKRPILRVVWTVVSKTLKHMSEKLVFKEGIYLTSHFSRKLSLQSRAGFETFDTPYTELFSSIIYGSQLLTNIIKYKEFHFRYGREEFLLTVLGR